MEPEEKNSHQASPRHIKLKQKKKCHFLTLSHLSGRDSISLHQPVVQVVATTEVKQKLGGGE